MYNPSIWINFYINQFIFKTSSFLNINIFSPKLKIFDSMIDHTIIYKVIILFIFILLDTGNTFYWRLLRFLFYCVDSLLYVYYVFMQNVIHFVTLVVSVLFMPVFVCYLILECTVLCSCYIAHAIMLMLYCWAHLPTVIQAYWRQPIVAMRSHFLSRRHVLCANSLLLKFLVNILLHNIFIC